MTPLHAIVLVGGKGSRLLPYTRTRPKALLELGGHSVLEIILRRLRAFGFDRVTLCVSHLGEQIRAEIGDGARLGLSVDYSVDERPLGTAAPLRLTLGWTGPAVVMNGDILTTLDFADLHRAHERTGSVLTVAFLRRRFTAGVGLVRLEEDRVIEVMEKPTFGLNVSSGIYVVSPSALDHIPEGPADMPTLINNLIGHGEPVHGYGFAGSWHDIGTPARYEEAKKAFQSEPRRYLEPGPPGATEHVAVDELAAVRDIGLLVDGGGHQRKEARA